MEVWDTTRGVCLGTEVSLAGTSRERRTGLLGRDGLAAGCGLWLNPCEAVHTFGMRFPIDVVFLDRRGRVRGVRQRLAPWRVAVCWRAESALELRAGVISEQGVECGDAIEFR